MNTAKHAASTARTNAVVKVRATETKTIKTACALRVARDSVFPVEEIDCPTCKRMLAADAAHAARLAAATSTRRF